MGVDHHVALAQLASQLMKDNSASDAQDQQSQLDSQDQEMRQNQVEQEGQDKNRAAMLQARFDDGCRTRRTWRRSRATMFSR